MNSTYTVLSQVEHDGARYETDSTIALSDEAAGPLLAAGAIEGPIAEPEAAKVGKGGKCA